MIIDLILDRKDYETAGYRNYEPTEFYGNVAGYHDIGQNDSAKKIMESMDSGNEDTVKSALCSYIINNEYNPAICGFVVSHSWLTWD